MVVNENKWTDIINKKKENNKLKIDSLVFNDYNLLIDNDNNTIYYSVVDSLNKYNPLIKYYANDKNADLVFNKQINDDIIKNNESVKVMIYNKDSYHIYDLISTTLPILNISYNNNDNNKRIPMDLYLFDNREKSIKRVIKSKGNISYNETDSEKKDYTFSLMQESIGHNERENNLSILGMKEHSEYVLNSLHDSEKIRNVFTTNLWNLTNDTMHNDNYEYVELFVNNSYVGLYSLGYNIEKESLRLKNDEFLFYKSTFANSENSYKTSSKLEGYLLYDNNLDRIKRREDININCEDETKEGCKRIDGWEELNKFYSIIDSDNIEEIKNTTNINNAINIYLFYLLVQPTNNINEETFSNTYLLFKKEKDSYEVSYLPWKLDYTFGNDLNNEYSISYDNNNYIMIHSSINKLITLNDEETIDKIKKRYNQLRNSIWSEDNLHNLINNYENRIFLSGAYNRDIANLNASENYNDLNTFKNYISNRLKSMDEYINNL